MKTFIKLLVALVCAHGVSPGSAAVRSSPSLRYTVEIESFDAGGGPATQGATTSQSSVGGFAIGTSSSSQGTYGTRPGFVSVLAALTADTNAPTITLNGLDNVVLECSLDTYLELGATVTDNRDANVAVVIGGDTVDTDSRGIYRVTYDATDASGNMAKRVTRTVTVEDTTPPLAVCRSTSIVLSLDGTADISWMDIDGGSSDACGIATLVATPNAFTAADVGPNTVTLTVTDISGNVSECQTTVTVRRRPATITYTGSLNGQYSDPVPLSAKFTDDLSGQPIPGKTIRYTVGTQSVLAATDGNGIATTTLILDQAPTATGVSYAVAAEFAGDAIHASGGASSLFTLLSEDARVTYTGSYFVSTTSGDPDVADVLLSATVQDITTVPGDPSFDAAPGDIRDARVTFVDRNTGNALGPPLSVVPIDPDDPTTGSVLFVWEGVNIGDEDSVTFEIGIVVSHYYLRNDVSDDALISVSKLVDDSVSGAGYLRLQHSAGLYAGDVGSKAKFGLKVKFNKKGREIKGEFQVLVRRVEPDGVVHTYRLKGTRIVSLGVDPNTDSAFLNGTGDIIDVTRSKRPVLIAANLNFQWMMRDNKKRKTPDLLGITVFGDDGRLYFSSHWTGTRTAMIALRGGDISIKQSKNHPRTAAFSLTGIATDRSGLRIDRIDGGLPQITISPDTVGSVFLEESEDMMQWTPSSLPGPWSAGSVIYFNSIDDIRMRFFRCNSIAGKPTVRENDWESRLEQNGVVAE